MNRAEVRQSVVALKRIAAKPNDCAEADAVEMRRALKLLAEFSRENECDIEGMPMYVGDIGKLQGLYQQIIYARQLAQGKL